MIHMNQPLYWKKRKLLEADEYSPLNIFLKKFSKTIFSYNNSLPYHFTLFHLPGRLLCAVTSESNRASVFHWFQLTPELRHNKDLRGRWIYAIKLGTNNEKQLNIRSIVK